MLSLKNKNQKKIYKKKFKFRKKFKFKFKRNLRQTFSIKNQSDLLNHYPLTSSGQSHLLVKLRWLMLKTFFDFSWFYSFKRTSFKFLDKENKPWFLKMSFEKRFNDFGRSISWFGKNYIKFNNKFRNKNEYFKVSGNKNKNNRNSFRPKFFKNNKTNSKINKSFFKQKRNKEKVRTPIIVFSILSSNIFCNILLVEDSFIMKSICNISAGSLGYRGRFCLSKRVCISLLKILKYKLKILNIKKFILYFKGVGFSYLFKHILKYFEFLKGFIIEKVFMYNLVAHNGCRAQKLRRL